MKFSYLITVLALVLDRNTAEARSAGGRLPAHLAYFNAIVNDASFKNETPGKMLN